MVTASSEPSRLNSPQTPVPSPRSPVPSSCLHLLQASISSEVIGVPDIELEFSEASQLCSLLLSDRIQEVLEPDLRKQRYPNLGLITIVLALDRSVTTRLPKVIKPANV